MAAIGPRLVFFAALAGAAPSLAQSDQPAQVQARLSQIANALSAGDPADAIAAFSKSSQQYDRLRDYFIGLTGAFSIVNEVNVLEENDLKTESQVTLHWAMTLTDNQNNSSNQRTAEIHARFQLERGRWLIVDFTPIDIFDPAEAQK
jgi:hypothetical protein